MESLQNSSPYLKDSIKRQTLCLPGFLGSRDDFPPSWGRGIELPSSIEELLSYGEELTLIGYSMGGRIALMFAATYPERVKKLIILSAHPGLDDRERGARKNWEEEWLSKMEDRLNFLKLWYGQPLFKSLKASPHFQKILLRRTQVDLARQSSLFKGYRLSDQKSFWPDLVNLPVTFFFGGKDEKFLPIHNRLVKMNIKSHIIQDGGHAFHLENQNCHKQIFGDAL